MADEQHPDWITTELRRAAVTERAPTHLHLEIDEMSRSRSRTRRPPRRRVLIPAVALLAAIVLALALVLPRGTPGGPTVAQAATLGAQPITYSPPPTTLAPGERQSAAYPGFAAVRFPSELKGGRWRFQAYRIAKLDGRQMLTIYYSRGGLTLVYLVAAAPRLRGQKSGFTSFTLGGHTVVSWQESNHSCLLSSANASRATLLGLARS